MLADSIGFSTKGSPLLCIPSRCVPSLCTPFFDWIIIKHRPRTKIGRTSQTAEYISNVIRRWYSLLKGTIPPSQDSLHHFDTRQVDVIYCRLESTLISVKEIEGISLWRSGVSITSSCPKPKEKASWREIKSLLLPKTCLVARNVIRNRRLGSGMYVPLQHMDGRSLKLCA